MKKISIYLTLLVSTSVFAQTHTIEPPQYSKLTSTMDRVFNYQPGPDLKKGAQKVLQATPKQAAKAVGGYMATNKGKSIVGVTTVGSVVAYNHLINNPEKMENYFSKHPELLEKFSQYVDYRLENAKNQKEYDTFLNVQDKLYLDTDLNLIEEQKIISSALYQAIEKEVRAEIAALDPQFVSYDLPNKCSTAHLQLLLERKAIFENTVNITLPFVAQQSIGTYMLDVNTHRKLIGGYKKTTKPIKLEMDHIPSYAAIETFLENKGITITKYFTIKPNGKKEFQRDTNLEANTSTIGLPQTIHNKGRAYGGKNSKNKISKDSQNLLEATILDISITAYHFSLDYTNGSVYNITAQNYIKSALTVYIRNKLLCLYDTK